MKASKALSSSVFPEGPVLPGCGGGSLGASPCDRTHALTVRVELLILLCAQGSGHAGSIASAHC